MYRIVMTVNGMPAARRRITQVREAVDNKKDDLAFAALNAAGALFEKNFDTEGGLVGGWADLAESTVREREAKGFGGEHPILIRYGDLRTVTATSLKAATGSGTFAVTDNDGKSISVTLKAHGGVLNVSAAGEKALNQVAGETRPARPYWFVDGDVQNAARKAVVERLAHEIERL